MMKIGVIPNSFAVDFKTAVGYARQLGVQGLQPYVTGGELAPENLTKQDRIDLLKFVRDNGLVFSALCADFGMQFAAPEPDEVGIKRTMLMMDLAKDLEANIITTHIGRVPDDENSAAYANAVRTIERLGNTAMRSASALQRKQGRKWRSNCAVFLKRPTQKAQKSTLIRRIS